MKAITLWEPWASFVAEGLKKYETRSWSTDYRGKILIHAAKRPPVEAEYKPCLEAIAEAGLTAPYLSEQKLGSFIAVAELVDCRPMLEGRVDNHTFNFIGIADQTPLEKALGLWEPGRFAWELRNVRKLSVPIKWNGNQGLWNPPSTHAALAEASVGNG